MDALLSPAPPKGGLETEAPGSYAWRFRHLPTLGTKRLILRKVRLRDARALYAYAQDPEVSRHVLWTAHQGLWESRAFIRQLRRQYRLGLPATFGIEDRETGQLIGTIGFMNLSQEHRCAEVGYSLARSQWNHGLMTEALKAVLRYAFQTLQLNRVEAIHEVDNPASGKVMEKAGMKPEGILRGKIYNKGRWSDVRIWAILREEWEQRQEGESDVQL